MPKLEQVKCRLDLRQEPNRKGKKMKPGKIIQEPEYLRNRCPFCYEKLGMKRTGRRKIKRFVIVLIATKIDRKVFGLLNRKNTRSSAERTPVFFCFIVIIHNFGRVVWFRWNYRATGIGRVLSELPPPIICTAGIGRLLSELSPPELLARRLCLLRIIGGSLCSAGIIVLPPGTAEKA